MDVLPSCMYVQHEHACALGGCKEECPQKLEIHMAVRYHVGQEQPVCKEHHFLDLFLPFSLFFLMFLVFLLFDIYECIFCLHVCLGTGVSDEC